MEFQADLILNKVGMWFVKQGIPKITEVFTVTVDSYLEDNNVPNKVIT